MSAWPEDPSHLLRWLDLNQAALADLLPEPIDASGFLPRRVYGLYLQSVLKEAEALAAGRSTLQRIKANVIDLEPLDGERSLAPASSSGYRLHLAGQEPLLADQVVLAWGNSALPPQLQGLPPQAAPAAPASATGRVLLRQLFDAHSCTYTYLIADPTSGEAALVDPVLEQLERDISLLQDLGLSLSLCLETHLHADHITAAGQLRRRTGCRLVVPAAEGIHNADQLLLGGERLALGSISIEAIATPGHTPEHLAYRIGDGLLFSGDALLIRGCGRTDFQNGDAGQLYDSLQRLLSLPAEMLVYPCHDDQGRSHSSIGEERRLNPKLAGRNREAFIQLMQQQRLAPPKRIAEALPANRHLGDLQPAGQHDQEIQERQRQQEQAQATEEANREIYNAFLGMFI